LGLSPARVFATVFELRIAILHEIAAG